MSQTNHSSKEDAASNTSAAKAQIHQNKQATAKATARIAEVLAPENIVVDHLPPRPDYPRYRVLPSKPINLAALDPNASESFKSEADAEKELKRQRKRLRHLQTRLYAEHQRSLLIVLQATDTGGKDSTIKHVFQGVNPQGCQVRSFKQPSVEELNHDFLWRYHQQAPSRGMMTIFNRSHYEEVLVGRVQQLVPENVWRERYQIINEFEHMLALNQIVVLKFFLHISKDEQKKRLEARLKDPDKRWKFSISDIEDRHLWDDYQIAYQDAINNCSTEYAPWYVVPANKKWYRNLVIARVLADTLEAMNPQYPKAEQGLDKISIPD